MTAQPFTPDGVAAMMTELSELSAPDLQTQVNLIQSNLGSWVSNNFTLTDAQQTFLNGMDSRFLSYAGFITGFAVSNGLSVSLTVSPDGPKPFKLIKINDGILCSNDNSGFSVSGSVTYDVEYTD